LNAFVEAVRLWVREIVTVLFLAGILEMLMPETDMKRFTRVAMGLFVVLAISRPILALVGGEVYVDRGLASLGLWESPGVRSGGGESPETYIQRGLEMQAESRDRALASARAALERQLAALALRDPEVGDVRVEVDLVDDPSSPEYGSVKAVRLTAWLRPAGEEQVEGTAGDAGPGSPEAGQGVTVEPVQPVEVVVEPVITGSRSGGGEGAAAAGSPGALPGEPARLTEAGGEGEAPGRAGEVARRLRSLLVLVVGVPPGGITVVVWP